MIDSRCYYYLINSHSNTALSFKNAKQPSKQSGLLVPPSETAQEDVWLAKRTHFDSAYYLVHCLTGLVLQKNRNKMELHHQHEKPAQYFLLSETHSEKGEFLIKEYSQPTNLLHFDKQLQCKKVDGTSPMALWVLKKVERNVAIDTTSIISCQFSGYVMQGSLEERQGRALSKESWMGCFNQRWEIKKVNSFFTIRNLKSGLLISLSDKKIKEGSAVTLSAQNSTHHYQLWSLEERGYNVFSIKTAYHQELYIGVKDHKLTEGCPAILVRDQFRNLWKIIGPILI